MRLLREAVLSSLPRDPFQTQAPPARYIFLPPSHVAALEPDNMLVVGARGTGKSFWWHVLADDDLRLAVADALRRPDLALTITKPGWSDNPTLSPNVAEIGALLPRCGPDALWRAVFIQRLANRPGETTFALTDLADVARDPEELPRLLRTIEDENLREKKRELVLFDQLDRTAFDPATRLTLLRSLLRMTLDLRSTRTLRAKVFVRPDMLEIPEVTAFPDGSKLLYSAVCLEWSTADLYGVLWQYLANADTGADEFVRVVADEGFAPRVVEGTRFLPRELQRDAEPQRRLFERMASPFMGADRRRGETFSWLPKHLGDAFARVSPRTFLTALRRAAELNESLAGGVVFHHTGIKEGVVQASELRVRELAEDFPWIRIAMEPLRGSNVPIAWDEVRACWEREGVLSRVLRSERPPAGVGADPAELRDALVAIGVLRKHTSGRLDLPDVYRLAFGLGRKGGVAIGG